MVEDDVAGIERSWNGVVSSSERAQERDEWRNLVEASCATWHKEDERLSELFFL